MSQINAVLLDVMAIQKYVFGSNRLKANIGASYLVDEIYRHILQEALEETMGYPVSIDKWKKLEGIKIHQQPEIDVEVASIGGGSALVLFRKNLGKEFVTCWTLKLLTKTPGLRTAVAIGIIDLDNFSESIDELYEELQRNKNSIFPEVDLPRHGIIADCPMSSGGAEVYYQDNDSDNLKRGKHISTGMYAKFKAANKANKYLQKLFVKELGEKFAFTDQLDQLGQQQGKDYVALIHIDGNNMAQRFMACNTLQERQQLSLQVANASQQAFRHLVEEIITEFSIYSKMENELSFKPCQIDGKYILPLRPIILGGDDITFVAHGQLGILYAERYMRYLMKQPLPLLHNVDKPFDSCAGIAIMKTSYPFFKGYTLAESLCASAKAKARQTEKKQKMGSSWLDYYIIHGEVSGSFAQMKEAEYRAAQGNLHFGPYCLTEQQQDEAMLTELQRGIAYFKDKWPRNKVKELRTKLAGSEYDMEIFLRDMKLHDHTLPSISTMFDYTVNGWYGKHTPYFDMIELLDFMPQVARKGGD